MLAKHTMDGYNLFWNDFLCSTPHGVLARVGGIGEDIADSHGQTILRTAGRPGPDTDVKVGRGHMLKSRIHKPGRAIVLQGWG